MRWRLSGGVLLLFAAAMPLMAQPDRAAPGEAAAEGYELLRSEEADDAARPASLVVEPNSICGSRIL